MMARTRAPIPAVDRVTPRQSIGGVEGSLEEGTAMAMSPATTTATGTMNRNTLPHQKCPSSHPPTIGPVATPTPVVAPHSPIALARSLRSVNTFAIRDSVDGKIPAAPMPMKARAAISSAGVLAKEPARLPAANSARPESRTPLRPRRSLRLPAARISAANTRLYASTTHCRLVVVAPSSRTREGRVTFTIVTSMLMMRAAEQRASRINPLGAGAVPRPPSRPFPRAAESPPVSLPITVSSSRPRSTHQSRSIDLDPLDVQRRAGQFEPLGYGCRTSPGDQGERDDGRGEHREGGPAEGQCVPLRGCERGVRSVHECRGRPSQGQRHQDGQPERTADLEHGVLHRRSETGVLLRHLMHGGDLESRERRAHAERQ